MYKRKKETVCHLTTVHPLNDNRVYLKEILSLANAGYKVDFIVKKDEIKYSHQNVNFVFLNAEPGLVNRIKNNFVALKRAVKLNRKIYHFHDPELIVVGLILKIMFRKKVIYDIHELYRDALLHKNYLPKLFAKVFSVVYVLIENISIHFFDYIVLAEEGYVPYYQNKSYVLVQNFVQSKYVLYGNSLEPSQAEEVNLLYLGNIAKVRGAFEILTLAKLLKPEFNFKIHLIGKFHPRNLQDEVIHKIAENDLIENFEIHGFLPFPEAQKIVKKCDVGIIFLHPILNNLTILPTKLFEYMGNGLAVLMSNFPLWQDFNSKYNCGLTLDIFNLSKEKEKILAFLRDKDKISKIGKNNIKTVIENFTWEIEEKKLLSMYENLLRN